MHMVSPFPSLTFASLQQLEASYAAISDLVFLIHPQSYALLAANKAFRRQFGLSEDLSGQLATHFLSEAELKQFLQEGRLCTSLKTKGGASLSLVLQQQAVLLNGELLQLCIAGEAGKAELEDLIAVAEADKKVLLNEVYHRVKNNLNIIISLLSLQLNRVTEPDARHLLLESKSRIYTLALLQEHLYASPRMSEINASEYLRRLMQSVISSFRQEGQQLQIRQQLEEEAWMNVDRLLPLGLIAHELLANAVQHAFPATNEGEISLELKEAAPGLCELKVQDNGRGLADPDIFSKSQQPGLGIQLVLSLLRQLGGSLQVESQPGSGTLLLIQFPKC
jgi:two-component sensor histidine kinase